jgi:hypothetical protein
MWSMQAEHDELITLCLNSRESLHGSEGCFALEMTQWMIITKKWIQTYEENDTNEYSCKYALPFNCVRRSMELQGKQGLIYRIKE